MDTSIPLGAAIEHNTYAPLMRLVLIKLATIRQISAHLAETVTGSNAFCEDMADI
jgi:hypothetical protein